MIRPVEEYEKEENIRRNAQIVESQMVLSRLEKEKRSLVERASKGKATEEEVRAKAAEIARYEPTKPLRLFVDDVTSEKLTSVLAENKGRAAVVSAEGGIFDIISGLYSRNVNIDVFLKGHSGDTIRVDRIGRTSESIIHPALTMVLAVQPEVLNGLMSNNTFRGRGLTARFLYAMPKSTVGSRFFSTTPIPERAKAGYQSIIEAILSRCEHQAERRLQPYGFRCPGREDRPDCHQVREPFCTKHRGQSDHHPQAEGSRLRVLLPEGKHYDL